MSPDNHVLEQCTPMFGGQKWEHIAKKTDEIFSNKKVHDSVFIIFLCKILYIQNHKLLRDKEMKPTIKIKVYLKAYQCNIKY